MSLSTALDSVARLINFRRRREAFASFPQLRIEDWTSG